MGDALADMVAACGADRPAVVCRELTKLHEEVLRGTLGELARTAADGLRGEICIVLAPGEAPQAPAPEAVVPEVARLTESGVRAKEAAARVAAAHGLRTREVYEAYLHATSRGLTIWRPSHHHRDRVSTEPRTSATRTSTSRRTPRALPPSGR